METATTIPSGQSAVDAIRLHVKELEPYTPILPIEVLAARIGRDLNEIVKLDANENLYGPSPYVQQVLSEIAFPHIYPDPENRELLAELSDYTGVPTDNLLSGAGADELIDLVIRLFVEPGDGIVDCPPTFDMYSFDAAVNGARVISVPRGLDFSLDVSAIEEAVEMYAPKLLFLTSPNNPDGSLISESELRRLLALPLVIVVDEAYIEFAPLGTSCVLWALEYQNLIVLRTFSKWAGLAGLRVGYGIFPLGILSHLRKIKQPYNVNVAAEAAAIASLQDIEYLDQVVARIVDERDRLTRLLEETTFLQPYPSQANFVLCRVNGRSAQELKHALEMEGIFVRYFEKPSLRDHIRISVGRPEHTDALVSALVGLA